MSYIFLYIRDCLNFVSLTLPHTTSPMSHTIYHTMPHTLYHTTSPMSHTLYHTIPHTLYYTTRPTSHNLYDTTKPVSHTLYHIPIPMSHTLYRIPRPISHTLYRTLRPTSHILYHNTKPVSHTLYHTMLYHHITSLDLCPIPYTKPLICITCGINPRLQKLAGAGIGPSDDIRVHCWYGMWYRFWNVILSLYIISTS